MRKLCWWWFGLVIVAGLLFAFEAHKHLTFEKLKQWNATIQAFYAAHPLRVISLFTAVYIVATSLCLPVHIALTVFAGYLFVQPLSTLLVLIAATLGATIIFSISKLAKREFFQGKTFAFLADIEHEFHQNGVYYLLFLRCSPVPFWVVNIAPALLGVRLKLFVLTTFFGLIPEILMMTFAGAGLEEILTTNTAFSLEALFNWQLAVAIFLLGLLFLAPVVWKKYIDRA